MFKDFGRRLQQDLRILVDQRIQASEKASGSQVKVSFPIQKHSASLTINEQSTGVEVNVISHKRQRYLFRFIKLRFLAHVRLAMRFGTGARFWHPW